MFFWDAQSFSDILLPRIALDFRLVPDHTGLSGGELAVLLTKIGSTFPPLGAQYAGRRHCKVKPHLLLHADEISLPNPSIARFPYSLQRS